MSEWRGMRRFKQQVDRAECEKVLRLAKRGVLSMTGDDGWPYGVPLNFLYKDGKLYFHGAKEGKKIDSLRKDNRVSFCVWGDERNESGLWWNTLVSVICFGRITLVEDQEENVAISRLLALKYYPAGEMEAIEKEIAGAKTRVQCLEMEIEHMTGKKVNEH